MITSVWRSRIAYETGNQVYASSVTPAIYLVNFLLLYMANPEFAAYMPAYKAAIPQPVVEEKRSVLRLKRFRDVCAQPQSQPAQADESGRIALIVR
jgi:hypothetical protein